MTQNESSHSELCGSTLSVHQFLLWYRASSALTSRLSADSAGHLQWGEALPARLHAGLWQTAAVLRGVRRRPGGGLRGRLGHAHAGRTRRRQPGPESDVRLDLGVYPEEARRPALLMRTQSLLQHNSTSGLTTWTVTICSLSLIYSLSPVRVTWTSRTDLLDCADVNWTIVNCLLMKWAVWVCRRSFSKRTLMSIMTCVFTDQWGLNDVIVSVDFWRRTLFDEFYFNTRLSQTLHADLDMNTQQDHDQSVVIIFTAWVKRFVRY